MPSTPSYKHAFDTVVKMATFYSRGQPPPNAQEQRKSGGMFKISDEPADTGL